MQGLVLKGAMALMVVGVLTGAACPPETPQKDPTPSEQVSQQEGIKQISEAVCAKYERCALFGPDKKYSSHAECLKQIHVQFEKKWPASPCAYLHKKGFNECSDQAQNLTCDKLNLIDWVTFEIKCSQANVCVEAATR